MYSNPQICANCGGHCCKKYPGFYHPSQLGNNDEEINLKLLEMLRTRQYSIDRWEGDPLYEYNFDEVCAGRQLSHVFMLRPRGCDKPILHDPFFEETTCMFLGPNGCEIAEDDRPMQCQLLEPTTDKSCIEHNKIGRHAKHEAAILWRPYQDMINTAINEMDLWNS